MCESPDSQTHELRPRSDTTSSDMASKSTVTSARSEAALATVAAGVWRTSDARIQGTYLHLAGRPGGARLYSRIVNRSVSAAALRRGIIRFTSHLPRLSHQPQEGTFLQDGYTGGDRRYCARLSRADLTGNDDWPLKKDDLR
ncbi:hypothetical protein GW17_00059725 [Ensete ventricosum]|nr:hypothetical protein GW17_00059725 [Ensete ventricosum]